MMRKPLFARLVVDENDQIVETAYVGNEPCYVVDDGGFRRHIPSEVVDRQVLNKMQEIVDGQEDMLSEQAAKMIGQDDIFTRAMLESQFKQMDKQFEKIMEVGIPEEAIAYMGMTGFRIRIDVHGEVIEIEQPGMIMPDDE
jgi:hypothetical protein